MVALVEFTRLDDGVKMSINPEVLISAGPAPGEGTVLHIIGISPSVIVSEDYATVLAMLAVKPGGGPATVTPTAAKGSAGGRAGPA